MKLNIEASTIDVINHTSTPLNEKIQQKTPETTAKKQEKFTWQEDRPNGLGTFRIRVVQQTLYDIKFQYRQDNIEHQKTPTDNRSFALQEDYGDRPRLHHSFAAVRQL